MANRLARGGEELTGGEVGARRLLELEGRLMMLERRLEGGDGGAVLHKGGLGVGMKGGGGEALVKKKGEGEAIAAERRRALEELLARSQAVGKQVTS